MTGGGLGAVETQRVVLFTEDDPLVLESGARLAPVEVAYETYGALDAGAANAVFVCHALTGDGDAAGHHGDPARRGWWDRLIGPGRPVDTDRFFVISPNLLGGCSGTTGPASANPATGDRYGMEFPVFSVRDLVTVQAHAAGTPLGSGGACGHRRLAGRDAGAAVGDGRPAGDGALRPHLRQRRADRDEHRVLGRREAIMRDPGFEGGHYHDAARTGPTIGLAIARMMAHITYLSEDSLREKFGRMRRDEDAPPGLGPDFEVEHYLHHQGATFLERFDALSYLFTTRTMDELFVPFEEAGVDERLRGNSTRFLAVSFTSDWRFDSGHSERIVRELAARGVEARHVDIESPWGTTRSCSTSPSTTGSSRRSSRTGRSREGQNVRTVLMPSWWRIRSNASLTCSSGRWWEMNLSSGSRPSR